MLSPHTNFPPNTLNHPPYLPESNYSGISWLIIVPCYFLLPQTFPNMHNADMPIHRLINFQSICFAPSLACAREILLHHTPHNPTHPTSEICTDRSYSPDVSFHHHHTTLPPPVADNDNDVPKRFTTVLPLKNQPRHIVDRVPASFS